MSIAWVNAGTRGSTTTGNLAVPHPSPVTAGNMLLLMVVNKYSTDSGPNTPADWTLEHQRAGGNGSPANDSGSVYLTIFSKIATGSETGDLTVTYTGTNNMSMGQIVQYSKTSGDWEIADTSGVDSSAGTDWSVTGDANPGVTAGDMLLAFSGINGNTFVAVSSEAVSQTGVSFGTMTERIDDSSSSGTDAGIVLSEHPVSSGTGSAAPVYTMTAEGSSTNSPTGPTIFIRLREGTATLAVANASEAVSAADTPTITALVVNASATQSITVGDTPTASLQDATPRAVDKTESVTVGEATTLQALGIGASASESIGSSDTPTVAVQAATPRTIDKTEAVGVTDEATVEIASLALTKTEGVTVEDAPTVAVQATDTRAVDTSESITVGDIPTVAVEAGTVTPEISKSETVAVTEGPRYYPDEIIVYDWAVVEIGALLLAVTDGVTVTDTPAAAVQEPTADLAVSVGETVTIAEVVTTEIASLALTKTETVTVTDTPTVSLAAVGAITISVSESILLNDTPAATVSTSQVSVSDGISVADAATVQLDCNVSVSQAIGVGESTAAEVGIYLAASESIGAGETVTVSLPDALRIAGTETVTVSEVVDILAAAAVIAGRVVVSDSRIHVAVGSDAEYMGAVGGDQAVHVAGGTDAEVGAAVGSDSGYMAVSGSDEDHG